MQPNMMKNVKLSFEICYQEVVGKIFPGPHEIDLKSENYLNVK